MKLYSLYLKFTLQNAIRFPKQATKVLPSLVVLLVGLVWSLFEVMSASKFKIDYLDYTVAMSFPNIVYLCMLGLVLYGLFGKTAIINARAADANFLMPSPMTPFQLHNFMELKTIFSYAGLLLIWIATGGKRTMSVLASGWLVYPLFFSILLSLQVFSFMLYISRTSRSMIGRYLKWIILVLVVGYYGMFYLKVTVLANIPFGDIIAILHQYYPIIGWNMVLMNAIITLNVGEICLTLGLLSAAVIGTYYWAKAQTYNYYEEELSYIQKTEAKYKRAYEGRRIELKAKFSKTNKAITQTGEKVLLDIAWLRAGKNWWMRIGLLLKPLLIFIVFGIMINLYVNIDNKQVGYFYNQKLVLLVYGCILTYIRFISSNRAVDDAIIMDTYVNLMPFKPIYKLLYPQVVKLSLSLLTSIICTVALIFSVGKYTNINMVFIIQVFLMTALIELFDLVRINILQPMTINLYFGRFFRQIIELIIVIGTTYVAAVPFVYTTGVSGIYLSFIIFILFTAVALWISLVIYKRIEKCKKSDSAY